MPTPSSNCARPCCAAVVLGVGICLRRHALHLPYAMTQTAVFKRDLSLLAQQLPDAIKKTESSKRDLTLSCSQVNVVLGVYVWVVPGSVWLYKAAFGLVAGPLTWSIVALRNSLVMHSLDQVQPACRRRCRIQECTSELLLMRTAA